MAQDPKGSVIRQRDRAVAEAAQGNDYDRENMKAYGFIYADGTYSDERQPRGATLVPRRPSVNHHWDPTTREWFNSVDGESTQVEDEGSSRRFRQTAQQVSGVGQLLPDRPPGGPAPLVGLAAEKAALEARLQEIADIETGNTNPTPPKTDLYPTHSVAHSVRGVVTSGDPAAAPGRPESVLWQGAGDAPDQNAVRAKMLADVNERRRAAGLDPVGAEGLEDEMARTQTERIQAAGGRNVIPAGATEAEKQNRGIATTGDEENKVTGGVAQQGASNTNRGLTTQTNAEGAAERGMTSTGANANLQPQIKADTTDVKAKTVPKL